MHKQRRFSVYNEVARMKIPNFKSASTLNVHSLMGSNFLKLSPESNHFRKCFTKNINNSEFYKITESRIDSVAKRKAAVTLRFF